MHRLLSSLVILAFASISNAAHVAGTEWAAITGKLESEYPSGGPGAYAIVAEGDEILYSQGFGLADVEQHVSWSADSVVRIASLTKQFTAVAVLQLIRAHKLLIGDRLEKVLPNCPNTWRAITIRELLNQTSGLTGDFSPLERIAMTDIMPDQLLDLYRNRPLDSPPGTKWQYSNLNYWILGKVIEIVSAQSYADYVLSHVLAKGMSRTRYGSHSAIILGRVRGYESDPKSAVINARYFSQTLGFSAGGFLSTPDDMARAITSSSNDCGSRSSTKKSICMPTTPSQGPKQGSNGTSLFTATGARTPRLTDRPPITFTSTLSRSRRLYNPRSSTYPDREICLNLWGHLFADDAIDALSFISRQIANIC